MDGDYAPEDTGKQVTAGLLRTAREDGSPDVMHLPDFLDVSSAAPFATWRQQFLDRRRRAKNATEGTASAAVDLCHILNPHFEDEAAWRRLLNRLGRGHIEASVAALARRRPPPGLVRSAHAHHVDTLAIVVGVPDPSIVVDDLFAQHGLHVENTDREDVCDDETLDSDEELHNEETFDDEETGETCDDDETYDSFGTSDDADAEPIGVGGGLLGRLGGALLEALGEHLDRRVDRAADRIEDYGRAVAEAPNVDGRWYSPNGGAFRFSQRGSRVRVEGGNMGISLSGQGRLHGRSVELQGFSPAGGPFRCSLVVSFDGNSMTGQTIDSYGRYSPVELHR
jgi:hypothetical protein